MGTPLPLGDKVCFATSKGKLIVTELDGTQLWTFQLGGTCHATPVAADGMLLVGCDDGQLYAFREKGPRRGRAERGFPPTSNPTHRRVCVYRAQAPCNPFLHIEKMTILGSLSVWPDPNG
jgi:hypothetical protein